MYAYSTGENREWTAEDARQLKSEYKRATLATQKHHRDLHAQAAPQAKKEQSPGAEERSFIDRLFRRRNNSNVHDRGTIRQVNQADLSPQKRPFSPKTKQPQEVNTHWWGRGYRQSPSQSPSQSPWSTFEREPYTPLGVANSTLPPPPVPPRIDLMEPLPERARRKSEHATADRRRAREKALHQLEVDHDIRRFVALDKSNDPPFELKPGTWMPGQLNPVDFTHEVIAADKRIDGNEFGGPTTPQLIERFPPPPTRLLPPCKNPPQYPLPSPPSDPALTLPQTRPLNNSRQRYQDVQSIPIPPIPAQPGRSNRDSFLEIRRKRSYYV